MKFFKAFILFFIPLIAFTQSNIYSISKELKDTIIWTNYLKSNEVLIEYSYQENNPKYGYKGEYLMLKVTNLKNDKQFISWDFSSTDHDGKCMNCDASNAELHFETSIPKQSYIIGNVNNYFKGPLVIFHRFTDTKYSENKIKGWDSFELKNLIII